MVTLDDIGDIKKKIADAKNKSAKAEGAKERLVAQLYEEFEIENGEDIDDKLREYDKEIDKCESKVNSLLEKLSTYDWDE